MSTPPPLQSKDCKKQIANSSFTNLSCRLLFFIRLVASGFGAAAIFLYFLSRFISNNWGNVGIDQLLWTLNNSIEGFDASIACSGLKHFLATVFCWTAWILIVFRGGEIVDLLFWSVTHPKEFIDKMKDQIFQIISKLCEIISPVFKRIKPIHASVFFLLLSIVFAYSSFHRIDKKLNITQWVQLQHEAGKDDFFEKYYKTPDSSQIFFEKKKNLIVVLNESLETTWLSDRIPGYPLMPGLTQCLEQAQSVKNLRSCWGTGWTAGASTAWFFGLPLKLPVGGNDYHSRRGYLPNAQSIFDVLKSKGYVLVAIMGSDKNFAGQNNLFGQHGQFEIKDRGYWINKGYSLEEHQGTGWGYNDEFVLQRAYEEYVRLSKGKVPFVIFVETIDLHSPHGWCPRERVQYNDVRDAILQNDRVASEFIDKVTPTLKEETVLAYIGDHCFMGSPPFIKGIPRRIFNGFWGSVPEIPENKVEGIVTTVDIAPTLLEASGARWTGHQYGVGISLFSKTPSLSQQLGLDEFNQGMGRYSVRYQEFY